MTVTNGFAALATDTKLEAVRALLAAPALPAGAATDSKLEAIRLLLAVQAGYLDGVETLIGTGNGSLASVVAALAGTLKVASVLAAATSAPLTGTANASAVLGPFTPQLGRRLAVKLWGNWTGSVTVRSSIDAGTTKLALTVGGQPWAAFTGGANEAELTVPTIAAETFYLDVTIASGTLSYWLGQ